MLITIPKIFEVTVRHEGTQVHLLCNGRFICSLPYDAALQLSRAIRIQAKKAEEIVKHEKIAFDQAILMRAGLGKLGLTRNRHIMNEAIIEAVSNTKLRKYMPGGVKSKEAFGTPGIRKHKKED